jgi:hypothetical protein
MERPENSKGEELHLTTPIPGREEPEADSEQVRFHPHYRAHRVLNYLAGVRLPWIATALKAFLTIDLALIGAGLTTLRYFDPTGQAFPEPIATLVPWVYGKRLLLAWILWSLQTVAIGLLAMIRWYRPFDAQKIASLLDVIAELHSPSAERDHQAYDYRATLFKARSSWSFGSWLGAVARSGHLHTKMKTIFSIDPDVKEHNTGFAGECWRQRETIISTESLPDQSLNPVSEVSKRQYQRMGWVSDVEYDRISVKSRVFLVTPILVANKMWGVLVLDSTDPKTLPHQRQPHKRILSLAAVSLGQLVQ